jgi:hypothetical protein
MSDDSFFREVNEEIRQEKARAIWARYGTAIIALAVLVVIGTAVFVAYEYWTENQASKSGDEFLAALTLSQEGKNDEALEALKAMESDSYGAYPILAKMRSGTILAQKGEFDSAVAAFDAVSADTSIPVEIRDIAKLRAGLILVDHGSYADVSARVETLTAEGNALRNSAKEALGLSAWKEGKAADALKLFDEITSDDGAPRNIRERATMLSELIRGSGAAS